MTKGLITEKCERRLTSDEQCRVLRKDESCHVFKTVPTWTKALASVGGPVAALLWTALVAVVNSNSPLQGFFQEFWDKLAGVGVVVAVLGAVLLILFSAVVTWYSDSTTVQGYLAKGIGAPFAVLGILNSLIEMRHKSP